MQFIKHRKALISVLLFVGLCAARSYAQHVDAAYQINFGSIGQYNVGPKTAYSTSIQQGVNAAGTTGIVVINSNYVGMDTWTNGANIRIQDLRPLNPHNLAVWPYTSGPAGAQTTLKAADYGAKCDGVHDDTANINAALSALTSFQGGANSATAYMAPSAVELPQGRCEISASLVSTDYGSIVGSPGGTWLAPLEPWLGSDGALIIITTSYSPTGAQGTGPAIMGYTNRHVQGISFIYNYFVTAHTAIKVVSGYGHTTSTAYPIGHLNPQSYQINQVSIMDNQIFAMDTGLDLEDCGQCEVFNNAISFTRQGIWDNGNNYSVVTRDNSILNSSLSYTPSTRAISGIISNSANRYVCTSGSGPTCRISTNISSPQGLSVFGSTLEHAGIAGNFINILGLNIADGSCFCDSQSTPSIYLNNSAGVSIVNSTISTAVGRGGVAIEIAAPLGNPGLGLAQNNGWWIDGNSINTDNNSSGVATGIKLDAGTYPLVNLDLSHNQFFGFAAAVQLNAPLTYSRITDNYGDANGSGLFVLNATGASSFLSTVISNNTSRDGSNILTDTAGGGYILGYNQSLGQHLGPQTQTVSGCTITSGAVGNQCASAITVTWANPFSDGAYNVTCTGQGGNGVWIPAPANVVSGSSFTVNEVALSTTATGGGALVCTGIHN